MGDRAVTEFEWHGWSRRDSDHGALHVGYLPERKSVCLYTVRGSVLDVHAYFRSEKHAETVLRWLDNFSGEDAPVHLGIVRGEK